MNYYNWEKKFPGRYNRRGNPGIYIPYALSGKEEPVMTPADRIRGSLSVTAYTKPGLGLILLRDQIIGPERFDSAFREYIRRWAYKHPTPADFFRTIEDGVGEDLSWFWRSWFYTTERLDLAVDSVAFVDSAGQFASRVYLSAASMPMPVELTLRMDDGSSQHLSLPVEIWYGGNQHRVDVPGPRRVIGATVDARSRYPDVRRENNSWMVKTAEAAEAAEAMERAN
jgi:aminopeptidase N